MLIIVLLILKIFVVATLLLLIGDFLSTFVYHVPEHIFGKFHSLIHHSDNRSFVRYAILNKNPLVLLYGMLGALPYFIFTPWLWQISPLGTILGLILGELHVIWRHLCLIKWQTPPKILKICNLLMITTPERHWLHHKDARVAFGDIFSFFDAPAQGWFKILLSFKYKWRHSWK